MDRQELLEWIEERALQIKSREYHNVFRYNKIKKPENGEEFFPQLRQAFWDCNPTKTEGLLKIMPEILKDSSEYTNLLYELMSTVKERIEGSEGWQPMQADVVQLICAYHPNEKIRVTGLEFLIANDIGSGTGDDITYEFCQTTGGCRFVFTEYYSAQEFDGYWKHNPDCVVHGSSVYTPYLRRHIWREWNSIKEIKNGK
jgi:hypothetical protein